MFTSNLVRNAVLSLIALSCFVIAASAQSSRVFVSAPSGVDAGACTLAQPCRTFTYALTQVNAKGEVVAVDSGEYDQVLINKAVTIQAAPGVYAGITVNTPGANAVRVIAGASDSVILRGLTLHAFGGQSGQGGSSSLPVVQCMLKIVSSMAFRSPASASTTSAKCLSKTPPCATADMPSSPPTMRQSSKSS